MSRRSFALSVALIVALGALDARADPLAVLAPDASGAQHPTTSERVALADAVSATLGGSLPDVLSGTETRSRIEVLDPAQLACSSPACAGQVVTLLRARGLVLVRPVVQGARLDLTLTAVNVSGEIIAEQHDAVTIADWQDALALGRVLAGRLGAAMRPPSTHYDPPSSASPTPNAPAVFVSRPNFLEVGIGGALVLGGIASIVVPSVRVAQGEQCAYPSDPRMPGHCDTPSALNGIWIVAGAVGVIGGAVLMIHGGTRRVERGPTVSFGADPHGAFVTTTATF